MYDSVGAGSEFFRKDGRKDNGGWEKGAPGSREKGWQDVRGLLEGKDGGGGDAKRRKISGSSEDDASSRPKDEEATSKTEPTTNEVGKKGVFHGLCVFINGSTAPMVGDHRLKQLLAENGARVSISLGRRTVTHVILGTPNDGIGGGGAGGGLAASKIQKEILRVGGKGVKYVGVEW